MRADVAMEVLCLLDDGTVAQGELNPITTDRFCLCITEARVVQSILMQSLHVNVGDDGVGREVKALRLGKDGAILGDQAVAAEDEVGR